MHEFLDSKNRTWHIEVNANVLKRVDTALGIRLDALLNGDLEDLNGLLSDPVKFADVLYVVLKNEITEANITEDAFGSALWGDSLGRAQAAFIDAMIEFCPGEESRETMRKIVAARRRVQDAAMAVMAAKLDSIDVKKIVAKINAELEADEAPEKAATDSEAELVAAE